MDYNSKHTGEEVEDFLDRVSQGELGVTEQYVNDAIANAITRTINTAV